ncbi:staphylococcal-like nuclease CAN2 [Tanacetum coccineum]
MNGSLSSRDDNDHHHESDSDEAYMDALDTLSKGETSYYNYSVSGAMTTDVPQHTLNKNIVKEKPREVKILVNKDDKKGQLRYVPNFLEDDTHDKKESEEESADDSDFDLKILANKSSRFCGLTPLGFFSMNRVRGMCMKTRLPISPAGNYLALLLLVLSVDPKMRGDVPERSIPFGKEANDELVKMIDGKSLKNIIFREDRYGRFVGDIYCNDKFVHVI